MKPIRFGFLSTANIGRKNWKSILDSGNAVVSAVASRDVAKAKQFIAEMQKEASFETAPAALGSYEELITSPNVDAVYVPLPTGLRKEWVLRAAAAGKHILCEKPCGTNGFEVQEMITACEANGVQFMDGVMFMHSARMPEVRRILDDGKSIGAIKRITTNFSFRMDENVYDKNIRINSELEPLGCLGDLGWYNIRFILWAMNWKMPREVRGDALATLSAKDLAPVPVDFSAELIFDENTSASFYCTFRAQYQNWVHVSGNAGWLIIPDFVHEWSNHEHAFEVNQKEVRVKGCRCFGKHNEGQEFSQHVNMIRNFASQIASGKLNRDWPTWALKTQMVVDACVQSAKKHS
jgi:predicted dehydrogenase